MARDDRLMRVLLTTPYDLAVPGGVNRHALDLLEGLTARGIETKLVGPASEPVRAGDPRIVRLGRVWVGGFNGARSRVTLQLRIWPAVRRLVREFAPDVVHAQEPFLPTLNTFAFGAARTARRVGTFHTYSETGRGYLWSWPWCHWVNRQLDARIAVSAAARDYAARFHPADYHVIPTGVRLPAAETCRPHGGARAPVRLLFVGRAGEPRKGFGVLRQAFSALERTEPGRYELSVVGPDAIATGPGVRWLGALTDPERDAAYGAADLVLVPSIGGESFGLVALEAVAHRVPVVASRIRGYADWLAASDAAVLVAPGSATELAAAVRTLANEPNRFAACVAATDATANAYDANRLLDRILPLYAPERSNELGVGNSCWRNPRTHSTTAGSGASP